MRPPDEQFRESLRAMRELSPSEQGGVDLHRAVDEGRYSRPNQGRWGRLGPVGLTIAGVALTGSAVAVAAVTGTLGFMGLAGSTAEDDGSTPALRGLVDQLEARPRGRGRPRVRSGIVTRDGIEVEVVVTDSRVCISAPGERRAGRVGQADSGRGETERAMPKALSDVPTGNEASNPFVVSCGPLDGSASQQPLPVISGTDARGSWIVAVTPDGARDVQAVTGSDPPITLLVSQNIATGRSNAPFSSVSWTDRDGSHHHTNIDTP